MSAQHPEEDLIDYEEDDTTVAPAAANGSAVAVTDASTTDSREQKGSYVGIHSTGFRDFLLKPELLRAISDLGFEHPSEGEFESLLASTLAQWTDLDSSTLQSSKSASLKLSLEWTFSARLSLVWVSAFVFYSLPDHEKQADLRML
jgi:hypothetical protein